jgi:hypothetical protein
VHIQPRTPLDDPLQPFSLLLKRDTLRRLWGASSMESLVFVLV